MTEPPKKPLAMPNAACWKALLDLEIQKVLDKLPSVSDIDIPVPILSMTKTAIGANTNFVAIDLTKQSLLKPKKTPCIFRIYICLDTAGIFSVQRTSPDKQVIAENMNQGVALTANAGYMFDVLVDQGEQIDFRTTVAASILKLSVIEKDDIK
jgi:hypothetical protein